MGKIRFEGVAVVSDDTLQRHKAHSRSLGLPEIKPGTVGTAVPSLAVVGGSPSVADHLDELREWDGDIYAINGTWVYLKENGIDATFYTIDPVYVPPKGITKAVIGDGVCPELIEALGDADITLVKIGIDDIWNFSTSAGTAPMFACWAGYKHVTIFGCDSSFGESTHTYKNEVSERNHIWVDCGGEEYVTSPGLIMQAEEIARLARAFPSYVTVRGDGFLSALVEHGDYDVTHICPAIANALKEAAA